MPGGISGIGRLSITIAAPLGAAIPLLASAALQPDSARSSSAAAATMPAWLAWGAGGLTLLLLVLLLAIWQRDRLEDLLIDARAWTGLNLGGLLAPLFRRRHVIHDPGYLRDIIRAEIEADPEHWRPGGDDTPSRPAARRGSRSSSRSAYRGRRGRSRG